MTTIYLKSGIKFVPTSEQALDIHPTLPVGNYIVKIDPQTEEYYLVATESFEQPKIVYGDLEARVKRYFSTFRSRPTSTGILLTGEKGSGKSMLARMLSLEAYKHGIPTIIINADHHGDKFNKFIQDIEQECLIVFDEFEKVYEDKIQEQILTLLDGVFPSKKMFILTCNDRNRLDGHLQNRPGRIFYLQNFSGLDVTFIRDYCRTELKPTLTHHIPDIITLSEAFSAFNFDMMKALVEEMNRYDESPKQALEFLNVVPEETDQTPFKVELFNDKGDLMIDESYYPYGQFAGNPLGKSQFTFYARASRGPADARTTNDDEVSGERSTAVTFHLSDLVSMSNGEFTFKNAQGYRVVLVKGRAVKFDMKSLLV